MGNGLDLDQDLGTRQRPHLDQRRGREVALEEFASRGQHLGDVLDVGDVYYDLDDVGHGAAGGLDQSLDLAEDDLGLLILVLAGELLHVVAARHHAGDIGDTVDHQAVRPALGRRLGRGGRGYAAD